MYLKFGKFITSSYLIPEKSTVKQVLVKTKITKFAVCYEYIGSQKQNLECIIGTVHKKDAIKYCCPAMLDTLKYTA